MAAIIAACVTAAATITVGVIQDQTQKHVNAATIDAMKEDNRLKLLSQTEKQALDYRVANAQNDVDKLKIYEDTLAALGSSVNISTGNIYAAGVASRSQQNYLQKSVILATGVMLLGGTIYTLRKK